MKTLALVTARGGSKGFPGKNLALLGGVPLVGWSYRLLDAFRSRHPFTRLFLSTDSPEIANAWPAQDRPHRLRPSALSTDMASSMAVVEHELAAADGEGVIADVLLLVQPTTPLLEVCDLDAAWALLTRGADCVVGMVPLDHPIHWTWTRDVSGILQPMFDSPDATRRQDLPSSLRPAGFYLARRRFLELHRSFIVPGKTHSIIVPPERGIDIDHPCDLWMAEGVLAHRIRQEGVLP